MSRLHKLRLVLIVVLAITSVCGLIYSIQIESDSVGLSFTNTIPDNDTSTQTVYVTGAVAAPGIYQIDGKLTVGDVITLAGGLRDDADAKYISTELNLAATAEDHQHIEIPALDVGLTVTSDSTGESSSGLISLNSASQSEIETLPGIGPSLAANILAARPFKAIDDLNNVKGIGDVKFKQLQALVTL